MLYSDQPNMCLAIPTPANYHEVAAGAALPLAMLRHTRGWWASEQTVPIAGAAIYCAQLAPPHMVR